ncbi:MAG: hypothetical protein GF400_04425 [Candidatus Eisenbacteria bacterium]|nr:hypothetical protein [Candidatus Eisenbacteria bacterium]
MPRAFVLVNPMSSRTDPRELQELLDRFFGDEPARIRVMEKTDKASEIVQHALDELRPELVVVAGGDGTISGAASALSGTSVPLAIVPTGTANMLAEQLGIPASPAEAMRLAGGEHSLRSIDAMECDGRLYFLNAGAGVSSRTVQDLSDEDKRRFGRMAYIWTGITSSLWSAPVPFRVAIDGAERDFRGIEVTIINAGFREQPGFPGVPDIEPDDGALDVMLVWTPTPVGYLQHIGDVVAKKRPIEPNVKWMRARKEISIDAGKVLPVQADGDLIGKTPCVFRLVPGAVSVLVPSERRAVGGSNEGAPDG